MCVICLCADRFGLGWAHDAISFACHMFIHFPCIRTSFQYTWYIWNCLGLFWLSFFLSLSVSLHYSCLWHLSVNPLQPGTVFVPVLLHHLILLYLISGFVMMMPLRHFQRTFLDEAFIRNAKSSWWILQTPTFPLSFTVGDGSHCVTSQSPVLSCLSRSFTPTCTGLIGQYLFSSLVFEVHTCLSHRNWLWMCFGS